MPRVPYDKPALDYTGQLKQLKDRGLTVENHMKSIISKLCVRDREAACVVYRKLYNKPEIISKEIKGS